MGAVKAEGAAIPTTKAGARAAAVLPAEDGTMDAAKAEGAAIPTATAGAGAAWYVGSPGPAAPSGSAGPP